MIIRHHNDDNKHLSPLAQYVKYKDFSPGEKLMLARKQQREKFEKQLEEQRKQKEYEEQLMKDITPIVVKEISKNFKIIIK